MPFNKQDTNDTELYLILVILLSINKYFEINWVRKLNEKNTVIIIKLECLFKNFRKITYQVIAQIDPRVVSLKKISLF